jgi:hypothetical protein
MFPKYYQCVLFPFSAGNREVFDESDDMDLRYSDEFLLTDLDVKFPLLQA